MPVQTEATILHAKTCLKIGFALPHSTRLSEMTQLPSTSAELLPLLWLGTVWDPWARWVAALPPFWGTCQMPTHTRGVRWRTPGDCRWRSWEVLGISSENLVVGQKPKSKVVLKQEWSPDKKPICGALPVSLNMPCSARSSPAFYCWHISRVLKSFVWVSTRESGYGLALHFPHVTQILDMVPRGIHFNLNTSVMDSRTDSCAFFLRVVHSHLGVSGDRLLFHALSTLLQWICTIAA